VVRDTLARELPKLSSVTMSLGSGDPSASALKAKKLQGFIVDGTIAKLSAARGQVECDVKAYVATYPEKSIKMMSQNGASVSVGAGLAQEQSGKKDCLEAVSEAIRDDVGKFLKTME
jgi:hypothetical protein